MAHPTPPGAATARTGSAPGTHQWIALVIGAVFVLVGLAGFLVTGFDGFAEHDHERTLLGFGVNPLHNLVHLLIGGLGLVLWRTPDRARTFGWILFVAYGLTFVYGLLVAGDDAANVLNINGADNGLHIASALAGLAIALWPRTGDPARAAR